MAFKHKKTHHHTSNNSGKNPKLFKIILQDTIQDGRLAIPRKFVKYHGDCLSNRVIIKVTDGTQWKMELIKGEKYEAWLQKGWKEFEQHYSLDHGFLLLFEYEKRSNFSVLVFDDSLLEIEYPMKPNSSPNLDKDPTFSPNLEQCPNSSPNLGQTPNSNPNLEQNSSSSTKNAFVKIEDSDDENIEFEGLSGRVNSEALEGADKFSCSNPWFKVVLKAHNKAALSLPIGFVRNHMDFKFETVTIKIEGGKICWETKFVVNWIYRYARLATSWSAFMKDNGLKDKDVSVFELIARNELKVHIFRHIPLNA